MRPRCRHVARAAASQPERRANNFLVCLRSRCHPLARHELRVPRCCACHRADRGTPARSAVLCACAMVRALVAPLGCATPERAFALSGPHLQGVCPLQRIPSRAATRAVAAAEAPSARAQPSVVVESASVDLYALRIRDLHQRVVDGHATRSSPASRPVGAAVSACLDRSEPQSSPGPATHAALQIRHFGSTLGPCATLAVRSHPDHTCYCVRWVAGRMLHPHYVE